MLGIAREDFVCVKNWIPTPFSLKLEWLNRVGSIKFKTALNMIEAAEQKMTDGAALKLIESSSGNLGLALASICAAKGYSFTCVVDPNTNRSNVMAMKAMGAHIVMVDRRDSNGGYLSTRIDYIKGALERDPELSWLNQYASDSNPGAHYKTTAPEIHRAVPGITHLFVGAGTTGTLMGCARYFREKVPALKIIAIDTIGSVTFGASAGPRHLPGLGTSRVPEIYDASILLERQMIPEIEAIQACRWLSRNLGILAGASTGSVLAAIRQWQDRLGPADKIVAISPDNGTSYLETLYDDDWVDQRFGQAWRQAPESSASLNLMINSADPHFSVIGADRVQPIIDRFGSDLIYWVEQAYRSYSNGDAVNPDSYFLRFPSDPSSRIIALPAALFGKEDAVSGMKWISSFPSNRSRKLPRASAVLVLNDAITGFPFALLESACISAYRTAASAVLGARVIREKTGTSPKSLAVVGAGYISETILKMFTLDGWHFDRIDVHDLNESAAKRMRDQIARGDNKSDAVELGAALDADVVLFATTCGTPYVPADTRFRADQMILNISLRDLPAEVIVQSNNIFDDVDHCLKANTSPHLAEQSSGNRDFVTGTVIQLMDDACVLDPEKATVYSPFGMGILDLSLGFKVYQEASRQGQLTRIPSFFGSAE